MQHFHVQFPGFGWEFDITNVAFTIGNYPVYWYGLIITGGLLLALLYALMNLLISLLGWARNMTCTWSVSWFHSSKVIP